MTDEEKEAIEYFRKREQICMENADICDENNFDEEATHLRKEHIFIETLLNLIEKQDNIIKGNECVIETGSHNEEVLLEAIEKKDKIINRMAKKIGEIMTDIEVIKRQFEEKYCEFITSDDDCCMKVDKDCSDCIKEYFEKEEV